MNNITKQSVICIGGPIDGKAYNMGGKKVFRIPVAPPRPLLVPPDSDHPNSEISFENVIYRLQIIAIDSGEAYPVYVADGTDNPLSKLLESYTAR